MSRRLEIFLGLFQTILLVINLADLGLWTLLSVAVVSSIVAWKV